MYGGVVVFEVRTVAHSKKNRVRAHVGRPTVHNRERVVYAVQMLITIQLIGGFRLLFEMYYSRFE